MFSVSSGHHQPVAVQTGDDLSSTEAISLALSML
jgi:hypothetical protein